MEIRVSFRKFCVDLENLLAVNVFGAFFRKKRI